MVLQGYPRFTADLDLVVELTATNASAAIAALQTLGYRPRAPVRAEDFADEDIRASWREDKGHTVFSLWSPSYPGTEVGRPKDVDDIVQLDAIAPAIVKDDENGA